MAKKKLTKRAQIDKSKARLLITVVIASLITITSLVAAKSFFTQANYLSKVAGEKEKAVKQLKANKDAVTSLTKAYTEFAGKSPNLLSGTPGGSGERDGDNGRLVLDALPSSYDFPALATSIEKLLNGYAINTITGTDDATLQAEAVATGAVEMPFSLNVSTSYAGLQLLLDKLDRSIRPVQITKLHITGTNSTLQADIIAKTFYQPETGLKIEKKAVK